MKKLTMIGKWGLRVAPGLLILWLILLTPGLRRADGWLLPRGWSLMVGAIALTLFIAAFGTRWQRCAGLLALALVGQACALQLIDAPPYSVYQRYFSWNQQEFSWSQMNNLIYLLPVLGLLAQTVIVFSFSRSLWLVVKEHLPSLMTLKKGVLGLSFLVFISVLISQNLLRYSAELAITFWVALISAVNLALVAAAVPPENLEKIFEWLKQRIDGDSETSRLNQVLPWLVAVWVVVIAALLASSIFERVPHIPDDVSYLFQAKYFSTGQLFLPAPPNDVSFAVSHVVNDGTKWYAYGFPGWPMVLALGVLAGVPWLVNPLLAGVTVLLFHKLLRRLYCSSIAHAAVLLLAASPQFLFTSASFMGHTVSGVWLLTALLAVENERQSKRGLWAALAGISLGLLFLTRPLEGLLIGLVVGLWALGFGGVRLGPRGLAAFMAACVIVGAAIFPYNYALTGSPTYSPHMKWSDDVWYPGADRLGFGPNVGNLGWPHIDPLPGHGPVDVVINANKNFYMTNFELFGWGFGSLLFAALMILLGTWRRADWIFMAIVAAIVAGHSFYWFSGGPDFGARYWYQALLPLIVLTVRGVQILQQQLIARGATTLSASRVKVFVMAASLIAFINIIPWRSLGKYYHYRGMSGEVKRLAQSHDFGVSLVFVEVQAQEDYASAFVLNPLTLEEPKTIYARDAGPAYNQALQHHYPNRPTWFIGRSPTDGDHLRVLAGPLPANVEVAKTR
jgi:hypothetical protein